MLSLPKPQRILIIADYSSTTGLGHVVRCLSIAQALESCGAKVTIALPSFPAFLDFKCCRTVNTPEDLSNPLTWSEIRNSDAIVLDSYLITDKIRSKLKLKDQLLIYLDDDIGQTLVDADMVVNPSPFANFDFYFRRAPNCRLLLGPEYAPLGPQFEKKPLPWFSRPERVLVSFGGADPKKLTLITANMLLGVLPSNVFVDVVLPSNVKEVPTHDPRIRMHTNLPNLSDLMRKARLAVTQVGGTIGELAASGTPAVFAVVQDSQDKWLTPHPKVAWSLAVDGRTSRDDIANCLAKAAAGLWLDPPLLSTMSSTGRATVDGHGSRRIARELLELLTAKAARLSVSTFDK